MGTRFQQPNTLPSPQTADEAAVLLRRATSFSLLAAGTLILAKAIAWGYTDSLSLLSSLVDSSLDIIASFVNFLAIRYALQPPDKEHRFGHGKAEEIAALAQSAFIIGSGLFICIEGIKRLLKPEPIANEPIGIAVTLFSIVVTVALVSYQRHVVRQTRSTVVTADSLHYVMDVLTNCAVLAALLLTSILGWQWADPLFALAIAAYIFYSAWHVGGKAFQNLMDREFDDAEREQVKDIIRSHQGVLGFHKLKTRKAGMHNFIQMHLELDENLRLKDAHTIADSLEAKLSEIFPNTEIIIHQDPVAADHNKQL